MNICKENSWGYFNELPYPTNMMERTITAIPAIMVFFAVLLTPFHSPVTTPHAVASLNTKTKTGAQYA
jgi:hypothetical protein